jgi:hypothetical protein
VVSAVLLGATAWPAFLPPSQDGFPLSTYPMFASRRGRVHEVVSARAIAADGSWVRVPPVYVANAETMQAIRTLSQAVRRGEAESLQLCAAIAGRLRGADAAELAQAVRVEIVTERVDAIDYLAGRARAEEVHVHALCAVGEAR